MKYLLYSLLFLISLSCTDDAIREKDCGMPCYPGDAKVQNIGQCSPGYYFCEEGKEKVCINYVLPSVEICDDIDNNCDGTVDFFTRICNNGCWPGYSVCERGIWGSCQAPFKQEEKCDGVDNDCDGIIDNDVPVIFCYDGDPSTLLSGECRPGIKKCLSGKYTQCLNQTIPRAESCNFKDDDCDGLIDEELTKQKKIDNIIFLDLSGSMVSYMNTIKFSFENWGASHQDTIQRFALVAIPDIGNTLTLPKLLRNFTDINTFNLELSYVFAYASGEEPSLDAFRMVLDEEDPFELDLPTGNEIKIILFTDEEPQSYFYTGTNIQSIANDLKDKDIKVFSFVATSDWHPIASITGGQNYSINSRITENLVLALDNLRCE